MSDANNRSMDDYLAQLSAQKHAGEAATGANATHDTVVLSPTGSETMPAVEADETKANPFLYNKDDDNFRAFFTGTVESEQFDEEPAAVSKKKKRGGLFGLFGKKNARNNSSDDFDFDDNFEDDDDYNAVMASLAPAQEAQSAPTPAAAPQKQYTPVFGTAQAEEAPAHADLFNLPTQQAAPAVFANEPQAPAVTAPAQAPAETGFENFAAFTMTEEKPSAVAPDAFNPFASQPVAEAPKAQAVPDLFAAQPTTTEFAQPTQEKSEAELFVGEPTETGFDDFTAFDALQTTTEMPAQPTPAQQPAATAGVQPIAAQPVQPAQEPAGGFEGFDDFGDVGNYHAVAEQPAAPAQPEVPATPENISTYDVISGGEQAAAAQKPTVAGVSTLKGGAAVAAADIAAAIASQTTTSFALPDVPAAKSAPVQHDTTRIMPDLSGLGNLSETGNTINFEEPDLFEEEPMAVSLDDTMTDVNDEETVAEKPRKKRRAAPTPVEYDSVADAPVVGSFLAKTASALRLRAIFAAVLGVLMLYISISQNGALPEISGVSFDASPRLYMALHLLAVVLAMLLGADSVKSAFQSFGGTPSADVFTTFAMLGCLLQPVYYLAVPADYDPSEITMFTGVGILLMAANLLGHSMQRAIVKKNFDLLVADGEKNVAYIAPQNLAAKKLCDGMSQKEPCLLLSRKADVMQGFVSRSFSARVSDKRARPFAFIMLGAALVCAIVSIVRGGGVGGGFTAFAAALCLTAPMAVTLLGAVTDSKLKKRTEKAKIIIPGAEAIESLGDVNVICVKDTDIFPASSVRLHGIKTFQKERIDMAILYAASVLVKASESLGPTFLSVLQGREDMLFDVENIVADAGCGYTAWIDNNRVIVGNRAMMQKSGVDIPSVDFEEKYTKNGERSPIYLAVGGKVFGMFIISYSADQRVAKMLRRLQAQGCGLVVTSGNFTVTPESICITYGVSMSDIKVLTPEEKDAMDALTDHVEKCDGVLCHSGSVPSLISSMLAAAGAAATENRACTVQTVALVFSMVLALVLSIARGLIGIGLGAVILYQVVWMVVTLILPLVKKN